MSDERKPFWVKCRKCAHCWTAAYLPMEVDTFAKIATRAACPMCGDRSIEALAGDDMSKQAIIDRFAKLVPPGGAITVKMDGPAVEVSRDKEGHISIAEVIEKPVQQRAPGTSRNQPPPKPEVPNVSADEAERMGRQAFKDDVPIIDNPWRPRWDMGWRKESGGDGMGPEE